jgi:hypothetical protein
MTLSVLFALDCPSTEAWVPAGWTRYSGYREPEPEFQNSPNPALLVPSAGRSGSDGAGPGQYFAALDRANCPTNLKSRRSAQTGGGKIFSAEASMVNRLKLAVYVAVFSLLLAGSAQAATISATSLGVNQTITVQGWTINILNGGEFYGNIEGDSASFWCVDIENFIGTPQTYQGNVTALDDWTNGKNAEVRKGIETNWAWTPSSGTLTPLQRYQAAAYLISETAAYNSGIDTDADNKYQQAAWKVLDAGASSISITPQASAALTSAVAYVLGHSSYGLNGEWAVVSGQVINDKGVLSPCKTTQTFLVRMDTVHADTPEPASFALIGLGLAGLALIGRRRAH